METLSMDEKNTESKETIVTEREKRSIPYDELSFSANSLGRHKHFLGLAITTTVSLLLFLGQRRPWALPTHLEDYVNRNRATVQVYVQILSNVFGFLQAGVLTALINQATRIHFARNNASLDRLKFWTHVCVNTWSWHLPGKFILAMFAVGMIKWNPSVLWAGALTPSAVQFFGPHANITIPSYSNTTLIREYAPDFSSAAEGLEVRSSKGVFSYSVGISLEGELLSSASTATTIDGSTRNHTKLDNSGFVYQGRSYGVGAPAGLTDRSIVASPNAVYYRYNETAYNAHVQCIYNLSAAFNLQSQDGIVTWNAVGTLPNSNGQVENSTYFGRDNGPAIVAMGVASVQTSSNKFVGITAGSDYSFLNTTQCSINFIPTIFDVQVNITAKRILVTPINITTNDIDPSGNLSHVVTRQLELISNDQTNLYQSLLGNSFVASISSYNISQANSTTPLTEATSTLAGLTNSIIAMIDDILLGYASAQLIVSNQSSTAKVIVIIEPLVLGDPLFVYLLVGGNWILIMMVVEEAFRTRGWRDLQGWDYADIRSLMFSSSRGGIELADEIAARTWVKRPSAGWKSWRIWDLWKSRESLVGNAVVRLEKRTGALVLVRDREGSSGSDFGFS